MITARAEGSLLKRLSRRDPIKLRARNRLAHGKSAHLSNVKLFLRGPLEAAYQRFMNEQEPIRKEEAGKDLIRAIFGKDALAEDPVCQPASISLAASLGTSPAYCPASASAR